MRFRAIARSRRPAHHFFLLPKSIAVNDPNSDIRIQPVIPKNLIIQSRLTFAELLSPLHVHTMSYYDSTGSMPSFYDGPTHDSAPTATPTYESCAVSPVPPPQDQSSLGLSHPLQHPGNSILWSQEDDRVLISLRAMGKNWNQIQREAYPGKTGNACRKRHERLMERQGQDEVSSRRFERLANEYMSRRKEIWQPLAQVCGEKWNVVEAQVSEAGPENPSTFRH